jgi:hypothetical protein
VPLAVQRAALAPCITWRYSLPMILVDSWKMSFGMTSSAFRQRTQTQYVRTAIFLSGACAATWFILSPRVASALNFQNRSPTPKDSLRVPRYLRYLRNAFSAVCGVVCLMLIVLWVHSYWWNDLLFVQSSRSAIEFTSVRGRFGCTAWDYVPKSGSGKIVYAPEWIGDIPSRSWKYYESRTPKWIWFPPRAPATSTLFGMPFWCPTLIAALFSVLSLYGLRPQFSLRTLLIATTLVAVGLGLMVYAMK